MNAMPLFPETHSAELPPEAPPPAAPAPPTPKPRRKIKDHPLARVGAWYDIDGVLYRVDKVNAGEMQVSRLMPSPYQPVPSLPRKTLWHGLLALRGAVEVAEAEAFAREAAAQTRQAEAYAKHRAEVERRTRAENIHARSVALARRIATWAGDDVERFERIAAMVNAAIDPPEASP